MKTANVGDCVVIAKATAELFELSETATISIYEIVDVRGAGANPMFTVAPIIFVDGDVRRDYDRAIGGLFRDDLCAPGAQS